MVWLFCVHTLVYPVQKDPLSQNRIFGLPYSKRVTLFNELVNGTSHKCD